MKMTIQELRQHQILVQDPEIDRTQYDEVVAKLREHEESMWEADEKDKCMFFNCYTEDQYGDYLWYSFGPSEKPRLTFDQFMSLQVEK